MRGRGVAALPAPLQGAEIRDRNPMVGTMGCHLSPLRGGAGRPQWRANKPSLREERVGQTTAVFPVAIPVRSEDCDPFPSIQ